MHYAIVTLLAVILSAPASAQVNVDIGIHFPSPPALVVVPVAPDVRYAPGAPANVFFYGGQHWVFTNGGWYVSGGYDGPWIVVAPQFVPRPILLVPVRYYRVPPGHWKQWRHDAPPRWGHEWGRDWADKRGWKEGGEGRGQGLGEDRRRGEDKGKGHGEGRGRGEDHGKGRGEGRGK